MNENEIIEYTLLGVSIALGILSMILLWQFFRFKQTLREIVNKHTELSCLLDVVQADQQENTDTILSVFKTQNTAIKDLYHVVDSYLKKVNQLVDDFLHLGKIKSNDQQSTE
jgi:hypothetical protein